MFRPSSLSRSAILPLILIFAFSITLVALSLLSRPSTPARKQHLGWQSWDVISYPKSQTTTSNSGSNDETDPWSPAEDEDWEYSDGTSVSLPLDNWDPLLPHTTGITEITASSCYFPPWLYPSLCSPKTTSEEDKLKGKWVRVDRDLNWKSGIWYLNLYYRRTRRLDIPLISSLLFLPDGSPPPGSVNLTEYKQAKGNFRDGVWPTQTPMRLWYKLQEAKFLGGVGLGSGGAHFEKRERGRNYRADRENARMKRERLKKRDDWDEEPSTEAEEEALEDEMSDDMEIGGVWIDEDEIITEIDVLYGSGPPYYNFQRIQNGPLVNAIPNKYPSVDIVFRKGNTSPPPTEQPRFHKNGKFKIMQIADLHFSTTDGECRDTTKIPCIGDPDSLELISSALDTIKPDMIIFTGDQLNGQGTSWDSKSTIAKYLKPVLDRGISWTAIFGNHDSEIAEDRAFQMRLLAGIPGSLAKAGPADVDGVGNYHIKIHSGDASNIHLFTLYFLDSHAHQPVKFPWQTPDYDYLKPSQISWFLNTSASIKPIIRPFTPDGGDDLGHVWRSRDPKSALSSSSRPEPKRRQEQPTTLAKPNAMMFFHIPVEESYGPVDVVDGKALDMGHQEPNDYPGNSKTNGGFFEKGLMKAMEMGDEEYEQAEEEGQRQPRRTEVKVVGHGHCHNTNKCRRVKGIYMCFGGGSSYSGYGHLSLDRRFRVYELSDYGETVSTYGWTESEEKVDEEVLIGRGAPEGGGMMGLTS